MVRGHLDPVLGIHNLERRLVAKNPSELAVVVWIQMLDHHQCKTGAPWQRRNQPREGVDPAGGGTDADDGKGMFDDHDASTAIPL